ncbi:Phosphohistidine phosphatase SixA [Ferriphaselus amnicola]|uniref:Phosphohistidine phosphatase SixA n=1 Tax=Ferriphaselus amnicola TaxID=1188319 RepID=A0A2Z6GE36_9PROT|nr:phosphohistidine phosphatase SixA [Ferriphaselus amnicola]BBE51544.1 Phosphohistidine phosphatase SixA [Ferriphaselus amnicola]
MELILWRHADAEFSYPDLERPLSEKGHKQARRMAKFLLPKLPERGVILVSPALRAQQTAAALGVAFITESRIAPDATADSVLQAADWPNGDGCVLIVGHQPTLGRVAARVLFGSEIELSVKKGSVWWMSASDQRRSDAGNLKLMITPEQV